LKNTKCLLSKMDRKVRQILPGGWHQEEKMWEQRVGGRIWWKYYILTYENGK
jgi:hypothetical protein